MIFGTPVLDERATSKYWSWTREVERERKPGEAHAYQFKVGKIPLRVEEGIALTMRLGLVIVAGAIVRVLCLLYIARVSLHSARGLHLH